MHSLYFPTKPATILTIGGTDVGARVTAPKRLMDRLENAAARGSERRRAVAMAEEFTWSNSTGYVFIYYFHILARATKMLRFSFYELIYPFP